MNNRGQTLILFLLIIPIIVGFLAFFVDLSKVNYERNRINSVIVSNLDIVLDDDIFDVSLIKKNFMDNDVLVKDVFIDNNRVYVLVDCNIDSLFGRILNFDFYKIKCRYVGNYLSNEVYKDEEN